MRTDLARHTFNGEPADNIDLELLPTFGGPHNHDYLTIATGATAVSAAHVDADSADRYLAMDVTQLAEAVERGDEGLNTTLYGRRMFALHDTNTDSTATTWVLIADGHDTTFDDIRWLTQQAGEKITLALAGGVDRTPRSTLAQMLERFRNAGTLRTALRRMDDDQGAAFAYGMPPAEWVGPDDRSFERAVGDLLEQLHSFTAAQNEFTIAAERGAAHVESWREFFDGLDTGPLGFLNPDQWSSEYEADMCWRCDGQRAVDNIGLCGPCAVDLKAEPDADG